MVMMMMMMVMMKRIFLLVALVLTISMTMTRGCCNPDQYESVVLVNSGMASSSGSQTITQAEMRFSYDYTNKRQQFTSNITSNNVETRTKTIMKEGKGYLIDLDKQTCQVVALPQMNQSCIPAGAFFVGTYMYGIGNSSFLVDNFQFVTPEVGGMSYLSATKDNCLFLSLLSYGATTDYSVMSGAIYSNITLGIQDPTVFDPPSYCPQHKLTIDNLVRGRRSVENTPIYHPFDLFGRF